MVYEVFAFYPESSRNTLIDTIETLDSINEAFKRITNREFGMEPAYGIYDMKTRKPISAGIFLSRDKADEAINWIQNKKPELLCFVRERALDKINGRFAFNMLDEPFNGDLIEDIDIF